MTIAEMMAAIERSEIDYKSLYEMYPNRNWYYVFNCISERRIIPKQHTMIECMYRYIK